MPGNSKFYTVEDLLASVKHRATVPTSQITYTDSDILRFANEEIDENLGPLVLSMREEFYLTSEDIDLVSGQKEYDLPYRAFGAKVRIIKPLKGVGDAASEGSPIVPVPIDRDFDYDSSTTDASLNGFYLRNDKIVLVRPVSGAGFNKMRVYFYLRPNNLVILNRASKITAIDTLTNTVTVDKLPTNVNSGTLLDIIQAKPPTFKIRQYDLAGTVNTANKTVTFSTTLPSGLVVGDYVCTAGETVCPQIPADIHPLLEQSVACKILEAQGDTEGLKNAYVRLDKIEKRIMSLIDNRIESPGIKVVNSSSFIRSRGRGSWGSY